MSVKIVSSSSQVQPQLNILYFPHEIIVKILSYLLNFNCPSYVSCLLSCRSLYIIAKNDPLLPKKLTVFQLQFFCKRNSRVELRRPNEYDPETVDIERYGNLLPKMDDMIRLIALREARGHEGKNVAKTTLCAILYKDTIKKALKEIDRAEEVKKPNSRSKLDEETVNDKTAVVLANQVVEGKLPADQESLFTAIRNISRISYQQEKIFIAILKKLAPLDLSKAEAIVASIKPSIHDRFFYEAAQVEILKIKAIIDPFTSFQLSFNLHNPNGSPAFSDVFKVILNQSFEIAEKLTLGLDPKNENRDTALYKIIKVLISKDIDKAWRYMQLITDDFLQRKALSRILTFAHQHNFPQYQRIVANIGGEKQTISDIALEFSIQLEAQNDIAAAKKTAENIYDPHMKGKAWLSILTFLASQQVSKKDIDETVSHLPAEVAETMMGPLANSNPDLALSLTLASPPSKHRDSHLIQIIDTTKEKDFAKVLEIAMHMTNIDKRDEHLLFLSQYEAGIENLDFMKAVAKTMLSSHPRIKHFDSLDFICGSIAGWLK